MKPRNLKELLKAHYKKHATKRKMIEYFVLRKRNG